MQRIKRMFLAALILMVFSGWGYSEDHQPLNEVEFVSVSLTEKTIDPVLKKTTEIHFQVKDKNLKPEVLIADRYGRLVISLDVQALKGKKFKAVWDGFDSHQQPVADGDYYYVIRLSDQKGQTAVYNPYQRSRGVPLEATGFYDEEKKVLQYSVPRAAMVSARVSLRQGGPFLKQLMDWHPVEAGDHPFEWDGLDDSGSFKIGSHPLRNLLIYAYSLSDNALIVRSSNPGNDRSYQEDPSREKIFSTELPKDRYYHAPHHPDECHSPKIDLKFPENIERDPEGLPVVSGVIPVTMLIDPADWIRMENSRYEIMLYLDMVFLFEDETGFSPFTYQWDTQGLEEGIHILTFNVIGYDDHNSALSKRVIIRKTKEDVNSKNDKDTP